MIWTAFSRLLCSREDIRFVKTVKWLDSSGWCVSQMTWYSLYLMNWHRLLSRFFVIFVVKNMGIY